jgi:hypothetical protein
MGAIRYEVGVARFLRRKSCENSLGQGADMTQQPEARIDAEFDITDDLLWQAAHGHLPDRGQIHVCRSGRIGPLVEIILACRAMPTEYGGVLVDVPFAALVNNALDSGRISGNGYTDRAGVFPLSQHHPGSDTQSHWNQWVHHAENAAVAHGLKRPLISGLIGALVELQDNVYEHSERSESGLVAYAAGSGTFEFVVADSGIGVLASLTKNPEFSGLQDSGEALQAAASDSASRYDRNTGRGFGIGTLFKALAHDAGELRFRSGDHAMSIRGDRPSLTGHVEIVQKAWLDGLVVSVRCASDDLAGDA